MTDHSGMKLGRLPPVTRVRGLPKMRKYLAGFPEAPATVKWSGSVTDWGMMGNDSLGDCTCAAIGHAIQVWTLNAAKRMVTLTTDTIIEIYSKACGYVRGDPSTDNGGNEGDVLKWWQAHPIEGHKLDSWAIADITNEKEIKQSIWITGGVYIAVELPLTAQKQDVWDVVEGAKPWWKFWAKNPSDPGSWGGHAVYVLGYDGNRYYCISWGKIIPITKAFWDKYVVEAHPLLSHDWFKNGVAPSGFPYEQVAADMPAL